jgi:hypothetical protein
MFGVFRSHSSSCLGRLFGREQDYSVPRRHVQATDMIPDVDVDLCTYVSESAWMTSRAWTEGARASRASSLNLSLKRGDHVTQRELGARAGEPCATCDGTSLTKNTWLT